MTLDFRIGSSDAPKGHALLYFTDAANGRTLATYVLVLPIKMDIAKYLPPMLASQLGSIAGGPMGSGLGAFAAPPVPEEAPAVGALERLARLRNDDLIDGGSLDASDVARTMQAAADAVQEYAALYQSHADSVPEVAIAEADRLQDAAASSDVNRVLFELLSDRDKLAELAKLIGVLRFALDRGNAELAGETEAAMAALEALLPKHYWVERVRAAAKDLSGPGETLSRLLIDRSYRLLEEDFAGVEQLERQIEALTGSA
ncbi:MAG: hypothetical protein OXI25_03065 [Chloroflexota bacterium]|nr:hypothetical protein [Chloroflexota bacterium]